MEAYVMWISMNRQLFVPLSILAIIIAVSAVVAFLPSPGPSRLQVKATPQTDEVPRHQASQLRQIVKYKLFDSKSGSFWELEVGSDGTSRINPIASNPGAPSESN
jgi:hypothetical protein